MYNSVDRCYFALRNFLSDVANIHYWIIHTGSVRKLSGLQDGGGGCRDQWLRPTTCGAHGGHEKHGLSFLWVSNQQHVDVVAPDAISPSWRAGQFCTVCVLAAAMLKTSFLKHKRQGQPLSCAVPWRERSSALYEWLAVLLHNYRPVCNHCAHDSATWLKPSQMNWLDEQPD